MRRKAVVHAVTRLSRLRSFLRIYDRQIWSMAPRFRREEFHDRKGIMVRIATDLRVRLGRQDKGQRR